MSDQPINVLLIDDDEGMEKIVRSWMRNIKGMAFTLSWAASLGAGLSLLAGRNMDIILLDLNLPDSGGLETVTRTYTAAPSLPIIVLTSSQETAMGINAVKMGAQDFLTKGEVNVHQLRRSIIFSLERKKMELEILSGKEKLKREYESIAQATRKLLSQEVVNQLATGDRDNALPSEQRLVTIMFVDIRNFTTFAEHHPATEVVEVLNHVLGEMVVSVMEESGYLDKFLGDGLMAIFGAPNTLDNQWLRAARAAFKMQTRIDLFNRERAKLFPRIAGWDVDLQVGIGLHSGTVIVGFIGAQDRCEYTAIGDVVNIASRLCAQAQGGEILISQVVADGVGAEGVIENWRILQLKGKVLPIEAASLRCVRL